MKTKQELIELLKSDVNSFNGLRRKNFYFEIDLSSADLSGANLSSANLRSADLSGANLRSADLISADLRSANLSSADLRDANLRSADLRGADLRDADLRSADLRGADLRDADLRSADLSGANLSGANLRSAKYNENTAFFALQCPEKGSFIAFKTAQNCIIELRITENALRSSATSRKCRASKADVLVITEIKSGDNLLSVISNYDPNFIYEVGKTVSVDNFDTDRWNECSIGIHFFLTKQEAINYQN